MTSEQLYVTLIQLLSTVTGVESEHIHAQDDLYRDLGADSLMRLELLLLCEQEYKIAIPPQDGNPLLFVQDVYLYLGERLGLSPEDLAS